MTKDQFVYYTEVENKKGYSITCCRCKTKLYYLHKSQDFPRPSVCPHCSEEWWNKPLDEALCFNAQKEYLANRTDDNFYKFYQTVLPYATRTAKGKMKAKVIIPDLDEKASDGTLLLLGRFLQDPDYKVTDSFWGILNKVLRAPLFKDAKHDQVLSLDWKRSNDDNNLGYYLASDDELEEPNNSEYEEQYYFDETLDLSENSSSGLIDEIRGQIDLFTDRIRETDPAGAVMFCAGVYAYLLQKSRASMAVFYEQVGDALSEILDKFFIHLRSYLYDSGKLVAVDRMETDER